MQHSEECMCRLRNIAMRDYQESVTTGQTHTRTHAQTDAGQSDPYVPLCFAGDTKTPNKLETQIKQNVDEHVGTGNVYCYSTCNMCCQYLRVRVHHQHFVLFRFPIYMAFFQLVVLWQVLGHTLSTRY